MQIILTQNEIKNAVESYLKGMLTLSEDKEFKMEFQTTRNPSGCTATVTIEDKKEEFAQDSPVSPVEELVTTEEEKEEKLTWGVTAQEESAPEATAPKKSFFDNL